MTTRSAAYELYKNDWQYHDGVVAVTYTKADGSTITGVKAKKELPARARSEVGENVSVKSTNATWVLWAEFLGDHEPLRDERFAVDGESWLIVSATLELWDTQWHCQCKRGRL
jgi:hypothetical protein